MLESGRERLTSTSSFGTVFTANALHLASPGNIPANLILGSSSRSGTDPILVPTAASWPVGAEAIETLEEKTFFRRPSRRTSVPRSRQRSSTSRKSGEERRSRVSESRALKVGFCSGAGAEAGGRNEDGVDDEE